MTPSSPPRIARAVVALVTPAEDRGFVLDDLEEEYVLLQRQSGQRAASAWYWRQALSAIGPGLGRRVRRRPPGPASTVSPHSRAWTNLRIDLTLATRRLRRAPVVALITVCSVGLGIGATTAVFSVADGLLFQGSAAIPHPDAVMAIYTVPQNDPVFGQTSFPDFVALDDDAASLSAVTAMRPGAVQ